MRGGTSKKVKITAYVSRVLGEHEEYCEADGTDRGTVHGEYFITAVFNWLQ